MSETNSASDAFVEEVRQLHYELCLMISTSEKPRDGYHRAVFLPVDSENYRNARRIGQRLYEIGTEIAPSGGGFDLMQAVFLEVQQDANRWPGDMKQLEIAWDGIGSWRY